VSVFDSIESRYGRPSWYIANRLELSVHHPRRPVHAEPKQSPSLSYTSPVEMPIRTGIASSPCAAIAASIARCG
jgi:hypothetical protein